MAKRVLFVNDTARNGGPGRTLETLLKGLDPAAIHRAVVLPRPGVIADLLAPVCEELIYEPGIVENPFAPWNREMERRDFEASARTKAIRAVGNVAIGASGIVRLARLARSYDAIFCNGTTANFFGGAIARLTGKPVVWHVFYTEISRPLQALHRKLALQTSAILCVSKPTMEQFDFCREKVVHLHDAIDTQDWKPAGIGIARAKLGLPGDAVIFGAQGRILRRKGFVELIRAAKALDDPRAHFVVLGDTPEDMPVDHLAECRALVVEENLEKRVHFVGYTPDVRGWANDFDVSIVPSVYPDPLPRSVMECMALEKPIVAFDVGGIGEMVTDGVNGALIRCPDVDGMARACRAYLDDPSMRRSHGKQARERIVKDFDAKAHAKRIEGILVSLGDRR